MKLTWTLVSAFIFCASASAKIVTTKGEYFISTKNGTTPLMNVNEMMKKKSISKIKTYGDGKAHLVSFSKDDGPVKLYSVDEKGFIYSIEPFSNYTVTNVDKDGKFQFKEVPNRKYTVDPKGFFFY